jgi:hypothetical protein
MVLALQHCLCYAAVLCTLQKSSPYPALQWPLARVTLRKPMLNTTMSFRSRSLSADTLCLTCAALIACSAVVNIEASDPQKPSMLLPWIVSKDGRRAVSNMVKCLGFALQGQQWNSVSFSPHSVVCPLFNLTRCFSSSDLCLDEAKVVSYITQLIRDSQRFSHWTVSASALCSQHPRVLCAVPRRRGARP